MDDVGGWMLMGDGDDFPIYADGFKRDTLPAG